MSIVHASGPRRRTNPIPRRAGVGPILAALPALLLGGCEPAGGPEAFDRDALDARFEALEARFTPGLHSLMAEVGVRHATLWFAGEAANWSLAAYQAHELEELFEEIEDLHPEYDGVPIAELLGAMTHPAMAALDGAIDGGDAGAFADAFDALTTACNACHVAADRDAIVIQRPTAPPLTNLRFRPGG